MEEIDKKNRGENIIGKRGKRGKRGKNRVEIET